MVDYVSAALCLYSGRYDQAIYYADRVRSMRECNDVLFIKARALTLLNKYKEADDVNIDLAKALDGEFDAKIYYEVALLNETQLEDPGLEIMQSVVSNRPEYENSILKLRFLIKKNGINLNIPDDNDNELISLYNSGIPDEELKNRLKSFQLNNKESYKEFVKYISKYKFAEQ
jgi:hypothetical protein